MHFFFFRYGNQRLLHGGDEAREAGGGRRRADVHQHRVGRFRRRRRTERHPDRVRCGGGQDVHQPWRPHVCMTDHRCLARIDAKYCLMGGDLLLTPLSFHPFLSFSSCFIIKAIHFFLNNINTLSTSCFPHAEIFCLCLLHL